MPSLARSLPNRLVEPVGGGGENIGASLVVAGLLPQQRGLLAEDPGHYSIKGLPTFGGCHADTMRQRAARKLGAVSNFLCRAIPLLWGVGVHV